MEVLTGLLVVAAGAAVVDWLMERKENTAAAKAERSITSVRREGESGRRVMDQTSQQYVQDVKNIVRR